MTHLSKELVRFRRGLEEDLYNVQVGEPVFTTDTKRLFVGSDTGNVEIATKSYVDGVALGGVPVSWNIIVDKPTTFTPSTHFHLISDVTGLDDVLDGKANVSHFHTITNVSGLQDALDGKSNNGHTHVIGSIEGLESSLNQRALSTHTHAISDVGGLQGVLDSKSPTTHGHAPFSITNDGFVPATGISNSTDFLRRDGTWATPPTAVASIINWGTITGDIMTQIDLQDQFATKASTSHTHIIGDVTGLQTALDGKASTSHTHTGVYEPVISAGTTAQYWRGDKTWQTLNSTAVGLGNVTNESKATMFSSPTFTGSATASTLNATVNLQEGGVNLSAKYAPISHTHTWSQITTTPTTLGGYGISDAYTKSTSDALYFLKTDVVPNSALTAQRPATTIVNTDLGTGSVITKTTPSTGVYFDTTIASTNFTLTESSYVDIEFVLYGYISTGASYGYDLYIAVSSDGGSTWSYYDPYDTTKFPVGHVASKSRITSNTYVVNIPATASGLFNTGTYMVKIYAKANNVTSTLSIAEKNQMLKIVSRPNTPVSVNASQIQGKNVPAPTATDDGKVLTYNHGTTSFTYTTPSGGGGATWGSITGTLSAQTDLWNQFSTKADLINPSFSGDVSTSGSMNAVSFWENGVSLDSKYMSQISPSYTDSMTSVHDPSLNPNVHIIKPQTNLSWSMFANNSNGMGFVPSLSPNAEDWDTFNEILFNPGAIYISGNMVYHSGNLPSTSWGSISGTLSSQSDLQSALNAKFNATGGNITGNVVITKSSTGTELKINSGTDDKQIGLRTSTTTTYLDSVNSAYSTFTKLTVRASALEYQIQPTTSATETGVCGVGGQASTATNNIQLAGQMVNFKNKRTTTPSSVTLTQLTAPTAVVQTPIQLHVDGFWLYVHTPASGTTAGTFYFWRGTYSV